MSDGRRDTARTICPRYHSPMAQSPSTYIPRRSPIHGADARVKLLLLLAYSVSLFFLDTWAGMALAAVALLAAIAASRLPARAFLAPLVAVYFIVIVTVALNAFAYNDGAMGFSAANLNRGLLLGARILLLAWASLLVTYSTTSTQLMDAFSSFLAPLKKLGVPADDIALALSLAVRFIPLISEQLDQVRRAQLSRGAAFDGGPLQAIRAWVGALVPVLVGLFRRGETLALAMEARCYGAPEQRSQLRAASFSIGDGAIVAAGLIGCIAAAIFL